MRARSGWGLGGWSGLRFGRGSGLFEEGGWRGHCGAVEGCFAGGW